ncbi:MAG TPA: hypothetical protein VH592_09600 [Gemmataceae bacterium]|jgi:hypothetical protein
MSTTSEHAKYHFSVTVHTDDITILNCLRAITQVSQKKGDVRIPSGGTKKSDWERNNHQVTFRFTSETYRKIFKDEAKRVLLAGSWRVVRSSDDDPATPQE